MRNTHKEKQGNRLRDDDDDDDDNAAGKRGWREGKGRRSGEEKI